MALSLNIQAAIRKYEPIETEGLTLYPITVEEFEDFSIARGAIEFMQQTLPVRYASMPLLSAYYTMDYEAIQSGEAPTGMFYRALLFLALSLRLRRGRKAEDRVKAFRFVCNPNNPAELKALRFSVDGEEQKEITPVMFFRLRPILAAQNGIELISETANPDLIEAEHDLAEKNAPNLNVNVESIISTVAALSHIDETDMYAWPILKLTRQQKAWDRILGYIVCGMGEMNGASWKNGNPYPNPFFDRVKDSYAALMPLNEFAGGEGAKAVARGGSVPLPNYIPKGVEYT